MATPTEVFESLKNNLTNAYNSLENKRAKIPENRNIQNLSSTVDSIEPLLEDITITPKTSTQVFTATGENDGIGKVVVNAVTKDIDSNIISANIRKGKTILGVVGDLESDKPDQEKTVVPKTTAQDVVADYGYELSRVRVNAVDKTIDSNIQPSNIKKGVSILGVAGSFEGGIKPTGDIVINENGKYDVSKNANAIVEVDSGEYNIDQVISGDECELHITDASSKKFYKCRAIDYDGTTLKEEWLQTGQEFTLPNFPTHDKLLAQEWSSPYPIVNGKITVEDNDVVAGVVYETKSGLTEVDIDLTPSSITSLTVWFSMAGTKDWGDGTINTSNTHTYADYGKYTITCDGTQFVSGYSDLGILGGDTEEVYYCEAVRIGGNVTVVGDFAYVYGIKYITLPTSVVEFTDQYTEMNLDADNIILPSSVTSFQKVYVSKNLVLPNTLTSFDSLVYNGHEALILPTSMTEAGTITAKCVKEMRFPAIPNITGALTLESVSKITIPDGVVTANNIILDSLTDIVFGESVEVVKNLTVGSSMKYINLPEGLTSIGQISGKGLLELYYPDEITKFVAPRSSDKLERVSFPPNITSASGSSFGSPRMVLDFRRSKAVPPLINAISGELVTAVVPDSLYDEWVASSVWSTYAHKIFKESEVNL